MHCNNEKGKTKRKTILENVRTRQTHSFLRSFNSKKNETINCSKVQWKQKMSQFSVKTSGIEGSLPEK